MVGKKCGQRLTVCCGDVDGDVTAGGMASCGDVSGSVNSGKDMMAKMWQDMAP